MFICIPMQPDGKETSKFRGKHVPLKNHEPILALHQKLTEEESNSMLSKGF
jgi:hypothetical protein